MKKIAALGMSAVMVAGMMAGCGSSSDSSSSDSKGSSKSGDKVELTLGIWDENQRDAMQKMIDAYEAENDNVSISIHNWLQFALFLHQLLKTCRIICNSRLV